MAADSEAQCQRLQSPFWKKLCTACKHGDTEHVARVVQQYSRDTVDEPLDWMWGFGIGVQCACQSGSVATVKRLLQLLLPEMTALWSRHYSPKAPDDEQAAANVACQCGTNWLLAASMEGHDGVIDVLLAQEHAAHYDYARFAKCLPKVVTSRLLGTL